MDSVTLIGATGAGLILIAFILNQSGRWNQESIWYDGVNVVGGLLLVLYAYLLGSWPFLVLNGVWTLVALRDVCAYLIHPAEK
jgi:hypothetical protein